MVVLDISIVNVALPHISHSLHYTRSGLQWVVNAYTLTFAGLLLLGGRAADLLGRRRVFIGGLVLFAAASLVGGLAQSGAMLTAARAAQGLGGAVLAPATLTILITTYQAGGERARALGIWSAVAGAGGAVGALIGGVLTQYLSWRWILFINVPIGAGGLLWLGQVSATSSFATAVLVPSMLATLGVGLAFTPLATAGTSGVPYQDSGVASGILNTSRQVGGSIGLAGLATLAPDQTNSQLRHAAVTHVGTLQAVTSGYTRAFVAAGILVIAAALAAIIIPRIKLAAAADAAPSSTALVPGAAQPIDIGAGLRRRRGGRPNPLDSPVRRTLPLTRQSDERQADPASTSPMMRGSTELTITAGSTVVVACCHELSGRSNCGPSNGHALLATGLHVLHADASTSALSSPASPPGQYLEGPGRGSVRALGGRRQRDGAHRGDRRPSRGKSAAGGGGSRYPWAMRGTLPGAGPLDAAEGPSRLIS